MVSRASIPSLLRLVDLILDGCGRGFSIQVWYMAVGQIGSKKRFGKRKNEEKLRFVGFFFLTHGHIYIPTSLKGSVFDIASFS